MEEIMIQQEQLEEHGLALFMGSKESPMDTFRKFRITKN